MSKYTNKEFMNGLARDDKTVIDSIYATYHKRIYAFAFSYLRLREGSLDVAHEVFIRLWEYRTKLDENENIEALIFTITRNTLFSIFRKRSSELRYLSHLAEQQVNHSTDTEKQLDYQFLKEQVDKLVLTLPPKRQQVFLKSRKEGLSNKEIAEALGISEKTVEDHITKALAYLRREMEKLSIIAMLYLYLFVY
jgi:RNA polymerase sigma-70 factor (family 1)